MGHIYIYICIDMGFKANSINGGLGLQAFEFSRFGLGLSGSISLC